MASGTGKWERVPLAPQAGHGRAAATAAGPHRGGADAVPLFAALAREWRAQGRIVPGARDPEWDVLVRRPVWPRR
ncbi:hypothetical protein [Streptomyces sp. DH12]|uniref:hypothetical protein n=1 Tax=Streptomyces sp. DH12 TaxID=2857010 RepID=UPI001E455CD8|nr:hypothetical protein [Streptomyces sp. DH12]